MSLQEIETAIAKLPQEELRQLSVWFQKYLAEVSGEQGDVQETIPFEQIEHLLGVFEGPGDLSTNPKYMEGFGERSLR